MNLKNRTVKAITAIWSNVSLLHCTVVKGGDKTYLVTFEYWFKFGLFGQFWIYFDGIQALNYF